eukprot:8487714-Heterocapsa_arctica.AAC.1
MAGSPTLLARLARARQLAFTLAFSFALADGVHLLQGVYLHRRRSIWQMTMCVEVQATLEVSLQSGLEQVEVLAQVERGQSEDVLHRRRCPSLHDRTFDRVRDCRTSCQLVLGNLLLPGQDLVEERLIARPRGDQDPAEHGAIPASTLRLVLHDQFAPRTAAVSPSHHSHDRKRATMTKCDQQVVEELRLAHVVARCRDKALVLHRPLHQAIKVE